MAVTPFIRPIQTRKGIFYGFQSSLEDLTLTFNNSESKTRFSHYIALRIPEIGTPDTLETDNKIQYRALGETPIIDGVNVDNNINMAESFQNYALNLEALLISRPEYNREEKLNVSEKVFWKWLKEVAAVRWQDANNLQKNVTALGSKKRFVEETETSSTYKRVVQYIGEIDVVNSRRTKDNSYSEIYIHIPTNVGNTPYVLYKSASDNNYPEDFTITNNPTDPLDIEYLSGRHFNDTHPFSLSIKGFFDLDDGSVTTSITDDTSDVGSLAPGNWFTKTIKNSYYTDSNFEVANNQLIEKTFSSTTIQYVRNTLDGITVDFDLNNYKLASDDPLIKSFNQLNDNVANKDFEFNVILIYYDVFDPNNLDDAGNPVDVETNLYGVLFLDKVEQSGLEFIIPPIAKYMPNPLDKINGNSFAFKLNVKLDNSVENVFVEKSINDFSTFSLELFTDVLSEFKDTSAQFNDKLVELEKLRQENEELKDLLVNTEDLNEMKLRLSVLETSLTENQAIFATTNSLMGLIESTADNLSDVINGNTPLEISYNLDLVRAGAGIFIDRSIPNRIKIVNTNQTYNISNKSVLNIFENQVIKLGTFANYIRHENSGAEIVLIDDFDIYIDDETNVWQKGQTLRLTFADEFDPGIFDVKIFTDTLGLAGFGVFGKQIAVLTTDDFAASGNMPIFEIVCVSQNPLTFKVDQIR